jgi:hypothetical protein
MMKHGCVYYADLYGVLRYKGHAMLKGTGKTGITPVTTLMRDEVLSVATTQTNGKYQKLRLRGFSARELEAFL